MTEANERPVASGGWHETDLGAALQRQRRGRSIAFDQDDLAGFLAETPLCRIGTVSQDHGAHLTPMWFVWMDEAVWFYSITRSRRWTDLLVRPSVSVLVDSGADFASFRGVELRGLAQPVGEIPRVGAPDATLTHAEGLFAAKYTPDTPFRPDGRHAWVRVAPRSVISWDFTKLPSGPSGSAS